MFCGCSLEGVHGGGTPIPVEDLQDTMTLRVWLSVLLFRKARDLRLFQETKGRSR